MEFKQYASSSNGNMYTVSDGQTILLLEAGVPFNNVKKNLGFTVSAIDGCLVTHEHMDHAKACKDLLKAGIELYTSRGTADALGLSATYNLHYVQAEKQFQVNTLRVLPLAIEHDCVEPLGFLIQSTIDGDKLLFITDTHYIRYRFKGLTHIAAECNHSLRLIESLEPNRRKRLMETHMSLETLLEMLKANDLSRVKEIHLLHLSDGNSDEAEFKRAVMRLTGKPVYISPV